MYLFAITTYPNEKQREDNYTIFQAEQDWYFGVLGKNGQILFDGCNTIREEESFTTYFLSPETDSLDSKNDNKYVKESYTKLLELCRSNSSIRLLGKSADYQSACNCTSPSWYMLYSDHITHESPVVCGDCGLSVPLYKLPKIHGEEEYFTVLGWQKAYNACDRLFMEGIGERSA
jgi:predicted  nucleic acid-binding Zn ribbon protein